MTSTRRTLSKDGSEWEEARSAPVGEKVGEASVASLPLAADLGERIIALAERCEREGSPDWQLDDAIAQAALGLPPCGTAGPRPYTTSIDAALMLVPDTGLSTWGVSTRSDHRAGAHVYRSTRYYQIGQGPTPALALCAAALRARAALAKQTQAVNREAKRTPNHGDTP